MKNLKSNFTILTTVAILSIGSVVTATAADYQTPADIVASITGRTVEDVVKERFNTGKTYGTIAAEAGKLDEFKSESLSNKEKILNENVEKGLISQQEADNIINSIKVCQSVCNGTGNRLGCGSGFGRGQGLGQGVGFGKGQGAGQGIGFKYRDGSCLYYN